MARNTSVTRSGWVTFAGYLMVIAGFFQSVAGLVAILKPTYYVVTENRLLMFDYTQWGWLHLLFGVVLILSAMSLFAGHFWGRLVAITLAMFSAVLNFAFISAYPVWSILIIVLDVMIIYAVAMYGGVNEES